MSTVSYRKKGKKVENTPKSVWIFDINRRVYDRDERGMATGGPIWRCHWKEVEIVGETRVSWITKYGRKVPKAGGAGIAFSEDEIDKAAYVHDNRSKISSAVMMCRDYETMKKIAEMLNVEVKQC